MEATTPQAVEVLAMEKVSINDNSTRIVWMETKFCDFCTLYAKDIVHPKVWWAMDRASQAAGTVRCLTVGDDKQIEIELRMFNITIIQSYYENPLPQVVLLSEGLWADFPGQHPPLLGWGPGWWTSSGQWWDFHHHHLGLWRKHWSLQYKILILYFALKNQRCLFALVPHYCSFGIWLLGLKMFHRMHLQWPHPARIWRVPANGLN